MLETIKQFIIQRLIPFIVNYLVRWSLKFVGSVLTFLGWEQSQYQEFVLGVVLFLFGIIWTLIVDKKKGE